ncbi:MAG: phosphoglycerate kinase [Alphaproteobacteria bacterium]
MIAFPTLDDLEVEGKRVLVRADLNVPVREGKVTDTTRIDRLVPTLEELIRKGARVILISHFGRPKGKRVQDLSLRLVVPAVSAALGGREVAFAEACVGPKARAAAKALGDGDIVVFENLRFHRGEEANDPNFAKKLAANGDLYVNDAFSVAHRAHASVAALARLLPAAAGRLMEAEVDALTRALEVPQRPVAAIIGGAKISTKLGVLANLSGKVDELIIGGAMANTFLHAQGIDVGESLCERDMAETARNVIQTAAAQGCGVILPTDAIVARELAAGVETRTVAVAQLPPGYMILDIGPASAGALVARLKVCRTLLWNGPLGAFEVPPFDAATNAAARAAAQLTTGGQLISVAGGGDTVAALAHAGVIDDFSYVSTAGGAFLEWLEGKELPGVAALRAAA